MIELTRLNGSHLSINCDLIKYVDSAAESTRIPCFGASLRVATSRRGSCGEERS